MVCNNCQCYFTINFQLTFWKTQEIILCIFHLILMFSASFNYCNVLMIAILWVGVSDSIFCKRNTDPIGIISILNYHILEQSFQIQGRGEMTPKIDCTKFLSPRPFFFSDAVKKTFSQHQILAFFHCLRSWQKSSKKSEWRSCP